MDEAGSSPTAEGGASAAFPWDLVLASVLMCGLVMAPFYRPIGHGLDASHYQIGRDFINNWAGPQIAWRGDLATLFDLKTYVDAISALFGQPLPFHNWGYPPFTLVLFWPLGRLPYFWALGAWTVLFFGLYAMVGTRLVGANKRWAMVVMLALAPACIINAVGGQNGFLTAWLLVGGVLWLEDRPILAGVLFGLLTLKPQLGLALPLALLALRSWRTILSACVTVVLLVGASLLAFGLEPWRRFLTETSAYQLQLLKVFHGFYTFMMVSNLAEMRTWRMPYEAAWAVQLIIATPVLIASAWAVTKTRDNGRRAFVLAAATPLITPYAFNYDLTALTLCLTARLLQPPQATPNRLLLMVAWLMPIWLMVSNAAGVGRAPLSLVPTFLVAVGEAAGGHWPARRGLSILGPPVTL